MKVRTFRNTFTQVKQIAQTAKINGKQGVRIAQRTASIKDINILSRKALELKSAVSQIIAPFFGWASKKSQTVKTILDTSRKVSRTVTKQVGKTLSENPNASKAVAKIKGLDASLPVLGSAALTVVGVNDVNEARKNEGTVAGVKEAGKSVVRVATSLACAAAGAVMVPVPGMATAGWLTGEKLANLAVGKPYTQKQAEIKTDPKTEVKKEQELDTEIDSDNKSNDSSIVASTSETETDDETEND